MCSLFYLMIYIGYGRTCTEFEDEYLDLYKETA